MIMEERMSYSMLVLGICVWLASPSCGFFWPIPDAFRPYELSPHPEPQTEGYTEHAIATIQHTEQTTLGQPGHDTLTEFLKLHAQGPDKADDKVEEREEVPEALDVSAHAGIQTVIQHKIIDGINREGSDNATEITTRSQASLRIDVSTPNHGNTTIEARHDATNPEVEYIEDIYDSQLRKAKKADEAHKIFEDFYQTVNQNGNISDDPILKILDRTEALRSWTENTGEMREGTEVGDIHAFEGMRSKRREMLRHSTNPGKLSQSRAEGVEKGENTNRQKQKDSSVNRSGSPPLHNTVNRVVLPDGDELSTFTGYPNGIVNSYTEVCTCNCNNFPNLATPPEPRCRWEMVFKAVAGNGRSVYDDFMSDNVFNTHHPEAREINSERPYKDFYKLEFWNELIIHQVRIDVYKQTARMAWFLFDAIGADKLNWMRSYRIISSSYTSLRDYDFNEVSVEGFGDQRFVMNIDNDDCCDHSGFLEVQDPLTSSPCCAFQEYEDRPYFLYSAYTDDYGYFETPGDYGIGDRFVISIKTCDGDW